MAHDIKVDCFSVKFKSFEPDSKGKKKEKIVLIQEVLRYLRNSRSLLKFKEYEHVFSEYANFFGGKFSVNERTQKGLTLKYEALKFYSEQHIISGIFEGGVTGQGGTIRKIDNVDDDTAIFYYADNILSKPYYFLFWLPENSNRGVLLVQSFSSNSSTDVFKIHFQFFLKKLLDKQFSPIIESMVLAPAVERMKKDSSLKKVVLRKLNLSSDRADRLVNDFEEGDSLNIEIKFTGSWLDKIKDRLGMGSMGNNLKFVEKEIINSKENDSFEEFGIDGTHEILLEFESSNGRKTSVKKSNDFKWEPAFYPDNEQIVRNGSNFPEFESINDYCLDLLNKIKEDIGVKEN